MEKKKPSGKFIFIDDDLDEHDLFRMSAETLGVGDQVKSFTSAGDALEYLKETRDEIFVIISDLNMPMMDGLELKRFIDATPELKVKAIPFFFHSNSGTAAEIRAAYAQNIQGYLRKATDINETTESLKRIIALWTDCVHPKDFGRRIY
jgi:CheY-like chemotaxis protein